ncbi:MAG TPA: SDR family oxidoreductase [Gammaproteobacteria bacterium]|nr:SDR family oxidoreductase [Gammaproteobacteria bacterium]
MSDIKERSEKVVLVTGSSSGFGRLTVETLARQGHRVYAAMRDTAGRNSVVASELRELASQANLDLHVIDLDVTDGVSIDNAVEQVIREKGRIDVLVNNAGIMNVGITEGYTLEQVKQQMDVNYFGPVQLDRAVIPYMRKQKSGLLVHVSSLAGRLVFPYFGVYCASKFAVEAIAESYRYELSAQGIDSVIVEPGPFGTALISKSPKPEDGVRLADYGDVAEFPEKMLASFEEFYQSDDAVDPQVVADDIASLIAMPREQRPLRTVSGLDYGVRDLNASSTPVQRALLETLGMSSMDPVQ